jgi:hypothetical protein
VLEEAVGDSLGVAADVGGHVCVVPPGVALAVVVGVEPGE